MKKLLLSLLLISNIGFLYAQLPNGGFENWTGGEPNGYFSINILLNALGGPSTVTKSSDARSGSSAVKLEVKEYTNIFSIKDTATALLFSTNSNNVSDSKFPVNFRPSGLRGYYKFSTSKNDNAGIAMLFYKWNPATKTSEEIGVCAFEFKTSNQSSTYKEFTAVYFADNVTVPDSANLIVTCGDDDLPIPGTTLLLDDLSLLGSSVATELATSALKVSFAPNPANDLLSINNLDPQAFKLTIKSMDGKLIHESLVQEANLNLSTSNYPTGMYLVELRDKDALLLQKSKFVIQH
jgi:hypothetical protein